MLMVKEACSSTGLQRKTDWKTAQVTHVGTNLSSQLYILPGQAICVCQTSCPGMGTTVVCNDAMGPSRQGRPSKLMRPSSSTQPVTETAQSLGRLQLGAHVSALSSRMQ